jgi:hypothetical protein
MDFSEQSGVEGEHNNTTEVTSGAGTSDPSEASPVFSAVHVVQSLVYLCSVLQISLCCNILFEDSVYATC